MSRANLLLKSQQYMLTLEGSYSGKIDGEWGERTSEAMQTFATDPNKVFTPATLKNSGDPFVPYDMLPTGYCWETVEAGERIVAPTGRGEPGFLLTKYLDAFLSVVDAESTVTPIQMDDTDAVEEPEVEEPPLTRQQRRNRNKQNRQNQQFSPTPPKEEVVKSEESSEGQPKEEVTEN